MTVVSSWVKTNDVVARAARSTAVLPRDDVPPVPRPPVSVNLLRLETTQGNVGAWHLEVSTFPGRIRSRKI
jgi:hypothetical protein